MGSINTLTVKGCSEARPAMTIPLLLLSTFKKNNNSFLPIVTLAYKDHSQRNALERVFLDSKILSRLFHSLRAFKREIVKIDLGLIRNFYLSE